MDDTDQGRGIVCADFDNDGDVDILQVHERTTLCATTHDKTLVFKKRKDKKTVRKRPDVSHIRSSYQMFHQRIRMRSSGRFLTI